MEKVFIEKILQEAVYLRKEGTAGSYYRASGASILPRRLSISFNTQMAQTAQKGRNLIHKVVGQLLGTFTKDEQSPLKQYKPYTVRTNLYQDNDFPMLKGYGTIGISNHTGKVDRQSDKGDLVLVYCPERSQEEVKLFFFAGGLMSLPEIEEYVSTIV
jgi:hypothetical protein